MGDDSPVGFNGNDMTAMPRLSQTATRDFDEWLSNWNMLIVDPG